MRGTTRASEVGSPDLRAAENAAQRKRCLRAELVSNLNNEVKMRANRPKLERRRQTLIHLGFRLSQGGLDAAHRDSAGANALELIIDAVIMA